MIYHYPQGTERGGQQVLLVDAQSGEEVGGKAKTKGNQVSLRFGLMNQKILDGLKPKIISLPVGT